MRFLRLVGTFMLAVLVTTVLGCIFATQFVLARFPEMNIDVSFSVRVNTTLHDILGMSPAFAPIVAGALLVGFVLAALLNRFVPLPKQGWYLLGGFLSVIAALLLMKAVLGLTPIAGTRGVAALMAQGFAGMLGAWAFVKLTLRQVT